MARQCIFCPRPVDSKEHLWSEWILEEFRSRPELQKPIRFSKGKTAARWIHNPEVLISCVCQGCNNGWMSDLEIHNKPHMLPMLLDKRVSLEPQQQKSLARWAILKAMVLEAANRERDSFYTDEERSTFKPPSSSIPVGTNVWIGRFSGIGFHTGGTGIFRPIGNIPQAIHGHVTTIVVAHLAIQVLTAHVLPGFANRGTISLGQNPGKWDMNLLQCWPVFGSVQWPPPISFTPNGSDSIGSLVFRWKVGTNISK